MLGLRVHWAVGQAAIGRSSRTQHSGGEMKPDNFMDDKIIFRRVMDKDMYEVKPETVKWVVVRYLRASLMEFMVGKRILNKLCGRLFKPAEGEFGDEMMITGPELMRLTKLRTKEVAKRFPRRFYDGFEFIE